MAKLSLEENVTDSYDHGSEETPGARAYAVPQVPIYSGKPEL